MKSFTVICKTSFSFGLWLSIVFSVTADIPLTTTWADPKTFNFANLRIGDTPLLNRKIYNASRVSVLEHPYVVSIRRNYSHYLTGALVSTSVVITVAHPLYHVPIYELGVVGGETYSDRGVSILEVLVVVLHDRYSVFSVTHDLALLRVYEDQMYRIGVKPLPLSLIAANASVIGLSAFVTGWGRCSASTSEICLPRYSRYYPGECVDPTLRSTYLRVDREETACQNYSKLGLPITAGMLCLGTARHHNASAPCLGVPGAPLVVDGQLLGVLSWGFGCGYSWDLPLVYTDVRKYHRWLTYNLEILHNTTQVQLTGLYQATKAYVLRDVLTRTRANVPTTDNRHERALSFNTVDHQLARLSGRVFDIRDFAEGMKYHADKKKMYRQRRFKLRADGLLLVNEDDYFDSQNDNLAGSLDDYMLSEDESGENENSGDDYDANDKKDTNDKEREKGTNRWGDE